MQTPTILTSDLLAMPKYAKFNVSETYIDS